MPGPLYHVNATTLCPHGGQATVVSSNTRVMVSGMPVVTASDVATIAGCAFTVGNKPQPCVTIQWLVPATRVMVNGQPVILQTTPALCKSAEQIPQGPRTVVTNQTRVTGI
ncbi:MAG: hypothetical protein GY703_12175 [Gammaproteobacteria bacterium]|nr:hypothetical protein [Gammaproteobacteria bacterium]